MAASAVSSLSVTFVARDEMLAKFAHLELARLCRRLASARTSDRVGTEIRLQLDGTDLSNPKVVSELQDIRNAYGLAWRLPAGGDAR